MLRSAVDHYRLQQRITAQGVAEARKAAKKGPSAVAAVVAAYQLAAARAGAASVPAMLAEQGVQDPATGSVATTALAGVTSAGFPLEAYFSAIEDVTGLGLAVATQIQDAGRNAEAVSIASRAEVGWVRMLNLPSCSRCIMLAGAWYKWNQGFLRHPRCDCRHVPATEAGARGLTTNPYDAFDSLTREQQDKIFTQAGAEAIRMGSDIGQVVNARRGMSYSGESRTTKRIIGGEEFTVNVRRRSAQATKLHGREALLTTEGTTKSGVYGRSQGADLGYVVNRIGRYGYIKNQAQRRAKRARLMPETIMAVATDREDAQRLLRLYGYLL